MLRNRCKVDGNADRKIRIFFETHALLAEEQRKVPTSMGSQRGGMVKLAVNGASGMRDAA